MSRSPRFEFKRALPFLLGFGTLCAPSLAQDTCESCDLSFSASEVPTVVVACSEGNPLWAVPSFPSFTSSCNDGYWTSIFKSIVGSSTSCTGTRPQELSSNLGAVHLNLFTATGLVTTNKFNESADGLEWTVYPNNVARLHGMLINENNGDAQLELDFYFQQGTSASEWIASGGNLNPNAVALGDTSSWTVWQIKPHISKLIGLGDLAGELIYIEPTSQVSGYPMQEGLGANGVNDALGLGGTFDWTTCVGGTVYGGYGSASTDITGCATTEVECASQNDVLAQYFVGNLQSFDQIQGTVDVVDDTPPVLLDVPADVTLNCPLDLDELDAETNVVAYDACGTATFVMEESWIPGDCPAEFTRIRVYTATDACGQTSSQIHTVQVVDEEAPVLSIPSNITLDCSLDVEYAPATAQDGCDGSVFVTELAPVIVDGNCPGEYTVNRSFVATDVCGNVATGNQVIQIKDLTPPELSMPEDIVLPCGSNFVYPPASASDNCTDVEDITISIFNSLPPTSCPQEQILERRFFATDLCGNSTMEIQTVTITDLDPPTFTFVPQDITLECGEVPVFQDAVVEDACASVELTVDVDTVMLNCQNNMDLVRTFVAQDECGNVAEAQQVIAMRDTTAPSLAALPENVVISCEEIWTPVTPDATDNCSSFSVSTAVDTISDPLAGTVSLSVTHVASDACGNSAQFEQTVSIADLTAPTFVFVPEDLVLDCTEDIPEEMATAEDACSGFSITVDEQWESSAQPGTSVITRIFTATDEAGNSATAFQTITLQDNTAPEFISVPANVTIECSDEIPDDNAVAFDNCSEFAIEVSSETTPGGAAGNSTITRTFTATDVAGNSASAIQTITVQDTTAPEFTIVPVDATIECSDEIPNDGAVALDNCGEVTISVAETTTPGNAAGNYTLTRIFTATDDAGNSTSATQTITIQDTTAPEFTFVPADEIVECSDDLPADEATAADNCGEVTLEMTSEITPGDASGNYVITRTFTATDDAGNSTTATQIITVQDATSPEFFFIPADFTVECSDELPMDNALASDNCGEVTIEMTEETIPGNAEGNYVLTRTFTATDDAGNSATATQTITVVDLSPPQWVDFPPNETLGCDVQVDETLPLANDNCDPTVLVSLESDIWVEGDCPGSGVQTLTFQAIDDAGNVATQSVSYTRIDTIAPVWEFVPANVALECGSDLPTEQAQAIDACSNAFLVMNLDTLIDGASGLYDVIQQWTATDGCGNSTTTSRVISVVDNEAPVVTFPADTTVACAAEIPTWTPSSGDDCSDHDWSVEETIQPGVCAGNFIIERAFAVSDASGNVTEGWQVISVVDTVAPQILGIPDVTTWPCNQPLSFDSVEALDNCSDASLLFEVDTLTPVLGSSWEVQITWVASDGCGNVTSQIQTLTLVDEVAPVIQAGPADTSMIWGHTLPLEAWEEALVTVDACNLYDSLTTTVSIDTLPSVGPCTADVNLTWTVSDASGNEAQWIQIVTLSDSIAPSWLTAPEDVSIACDELWLPVEPLVLDSNDVSTFESLDTLMGACASNWTLVRTLVAEDVCGNSSDPWVQTITFIDTVPPSAISWPEDLVLSDVNDIPPCLGDDSIWEDNCSEWTATCMDDTVEWYCPGSFLLLRTFSAEDQCGNVQSVSQSILVEDSAPPVWENFPPNLVVSCDSTVLAETVSNLSATDNATAPSDLTIVWESSTSEGDGCHWFETHAYVASDGCGNSSFAEYVVEFEDTIPPALSLPLEALEFTCWAEIPACEDQPVGEVEDCNDWSFECEDLFTADSCTGPNCVLTRRIVLTDACTNSVEVNQIFTVLGTPSAPDLPSAFSPNDDTFNDVYLIRTLDFEPGALPCGWLENTTLTVFDRWGSLVYQSNDFNAPWDGSNLQGQQLPVGTYFIVFEANGQTYHQSVDLRR